VRASAIPQRPRIPAIDICDYRDRPDQYEILGSYRRIAELCLKDRHPALYFLRLAK